jgi:Rrf2 family protein
MRLELTRRTDYAVRATLELTRSRGQIVSGTQLAQRTAIPVRFVTQVMAELVGVGMVGAVIGRSGGYRLDADPESVTVLAIIEAVEGDPRRVHCALRGGPCQRVTPCEIHHVFARAQEAFVAELASWSLAAVAASEPVSQSRRGVSPYRQRPERGAED